MSCSIATALAVSAGAEPALEAGFKEPPIASRPGAFWPWLNANTDRDRIRYDLQQMKEKGMGGAEIWDVQAMRNSFMVPAGPEFLSPESVETIRFALDEAKKLGLRMGMITSSGWNAGGTWVEPDWASKLLVFSSTATTGPATITQQIVFPSCPDHCPLDSDGKPRYYRDIALLAVPASADKHITSTTEIIDLTGQMTDDGWLKWTVPDGNWNILRFVCTNTGQELIVPSPKSKGLFIDFLDPNATRRHMQLIMDRLGLTRENAAESGLHYMEVDSMELHEGNPWTDNFAEWFNDNRGYDLTRFLPVLAGYTIGDKKSTEAFEYDYRNAISDLLIHSHYETGSNFLAEYGMEFVGEAGGPGPPIWDTCPVDALKALGQVHVPRGEFWIQHRNMFLVKEVASASHIYGKPLVDGEAFTTWRRWEDSPFALKVIADRAFAEGLNHLTIHTFAHSPDTAGLPGWTYHAGVDINPNVTWWPLAKPFMDYLSRCSYMLRQGNPVSDVLWYYGDQAPNFFPTFHDVPEKPRLPGLGRGYDYDVINSEVILDRLSVRDGRFVLPEGTSYRVLAFPDDAAMPVEVLQKLEKLVLAGGVILGKPPRQAPGLYDRPARNEALKEIVARLWSNNAGTTSTGHGKGRVYASGTLDEVLLAEGIEPDFQALSPKGKLQLDYVHRQTADADIYFVRNEFEQATTANLRFRAGNRKPALWDPATGEIGETNPVSRAVSDQGILSCNVTPQYADVQLKLAPGGAVFLVFSESSACSDGVSDVTWESFDILPHGGWNVRFPADSGAPTSVTLEKLVSLTKHSDFDIRHFSGIAEYTTIFDAPVNAAASKASAILDLGKVHDLAEVIINGQSAGITWKLPYRVDVSGLLKPGENEIRVRVANLWHNRLVADSKLPPEQRVTSTNQPLNAKEKAGLQDSGVVGPVRLLTVPTPRP